MEHYFDDPPVGADEPSRMPKTVDSAPNRSDRSDEDMCAP
ncbi:hypothetical protein BTZ20_0954 [Rhodococcus sp. MTM3W5.2]|nr:hypothetical protein BTZ20_0954 [Rhodococcus sp. MTM3W5.2]